MDVEVLISFCLEEVDCRLLVELPEPLRIGLADGEVVEAGLGLLPLEEDGEGLAGACAGAFTSSLSFHAAVGAA